MEGTGEKECPNSKSMSDAQVASYTAFNLQARPDLRMVVGIFVKKDGFKIFASNACRVYHTDDIPWIDEDMPRRLLCVCMFRLHVPKLDSSLKIDYTYGRLEHLTFTLVQKGKTYSNMSIVHAGESIGRRTMVMTCLNPKPEDNVVVVKEQYIEEGRRFTEENILRKIHQNGRFPGVVSLVPDSPSSTTSISVSCGDVGTPEWIQRSKTRIVLAERGRFLLSGTTPKEMLMAMFDALEGELALPIHAFWLIFSPVSRNLFKRRNILHRDLSKNNILLRDKLAQYSLNSDDLRDMCFSDYLLDEGGQGEGICSECAAQTSSLMVLG